MWGLASDPGKTGADGARMGGERGVRLEREGRALADAPPAGPVGVRGYHPRFQALLERYASDVERE